MLRNRALLCAFDLASVPSLAAQARQQPLPDGVLDVIRIAAGCEETLDEAVKLSRRDPAFIKSAAELYVQQILCSPRLIVIGFWGSERALPARRCEVICAG